MWNCIVVPGLKEAAVRAITYHNWTPVRALLEGTLDKKGIEYTQLQQIHLHKNIIEQACLRGFVELVNLFLNSGFTVNDLVNTTADIRMPCLGGHKTMLHFAAGGGHLSLVKWLLHVGAYIDCRMYSGETPLFLATEGVHLEVVKYLITAGADINTCDEDGKSLLDAALCAYNVTEEMLQFLLYCGCHPNKSSIYWAVCSWGMRSSEVRSNNINCMKMVLDAGANVNGVNTDIPLHMAAGKGYVSIMELLLEYGADINARGRNGYTALHEAVGCRKIQSVEFLLNHCISINSVSNTHETPLLLSMNPLECDIAMMLLNNGTDLNLGVHDRVLNTAVMGYTSIHVIEHLLERGVSVTIEHLNKTALQRVICDWLISDDWKLHVAKLLLIYGSNHYVEDNYGNTLLHWACKMGDVGLVKYFLNYGLNVAAKNRQGKTPYEIAIEKGHTNIVKAIVHYHCNKYTHF